MIKKAIIVFICTLMCVTVLPVTATINQNLDTNLVCTGLAPISNIDSTARSLPFYAVNDETDYFCSFDPSDPGTFTDIGPATPTGFIQNACFVEDIYWVVDQYGTLYTVDVTTGVFTTVGSAGVTDTMGLAYDDTTGKMFMTAGSSANGKLYEVDMGTGHATLIGTMGNTGFAMISLVVDNDGQLYGLEISSATTPGQLYSIDKTTGAATKIGTGLGFNMNYGQDAEYDKDNDIFYFCAYNANTGAEFRIVDKTAGTSELVGSLPGQTTGFGIPYSSNLPPETPPAPTGPDTGLKGVELTFSASTTDPEGEQIYYLFDWGDGTNSSWVGPFGSGATGTAKKTYNAVGTFSITVKAKDINDRESGWSESHSISIIEGAPILQIQTITGGLFKAKTSIKNVGTLPATNVNWNITFTGGAFIGKETTGNIPSLAAGASVDISSKFVLGFGKTTVKVMASGSGTSDMKEQDGMIILFLIRL